LSQRAENNRSDGKISTDRAAARVSSRQHGNAPFGHTFNAGGDQRVGQLANEIMNGVQNPVWNAT
jgi:hypothetical protein